MTPMHYHKLVRIERAGELLQFSNMTITDIAEKLGFESINDFSRAFKNIKGVSPSFYRE